MANDRESLKIDLELKTLIRAEKVRRQSLGIKGVTEPGLVAEAWEIAVAYNWGNQQLKKLRNWLRENLQ